MIDFYNKFMDKNSDLGVNILNALIIFVLGWYIVKLVVYIFEKMMKRSSIDPIVINFIKLVLLTALRIIVFITAIGEMGVSTTSLIAVLTTAGAALVLGLQDSMKGIVSGIIILFAKPFVKGDIIEVNHYIGKIEEIQLLYTILLTFDNKMVVIPNNELASSTFVNYSHEDIRRVDLTMDVHYDTDIELAKELIMNVILNHELILDDPLPYVRVSEYKEDGIAIGLRAWTQTDHYYDVKDDLLEQIKVEFDKHHIQIPYSQIDVHIKSKE